MDAHVSPTSQLGFTKAKTFAGFAVKEFRQPPYRRLPWHEHREASICYVAAGSYMERVRGLDRECSPHTMVFKPPLERHADQFGDLDADTRRALNRLDVSTTDGIDRLDRFAM